jgi:hypothetical protein
MDRISRRRWMAAVAAGWSVEARAQQTVNLLVTVLDPSAAPVSDAMVILVQNPNRHWDKTWVQEIVRTLPDGSAGLFLNKGARYTVEVRAKGFEPWAKAGVKAGKLSVVLAVTIPPLI